MSIHRPPALLAIVIYKCLEATILLATAIAAIFASKYHQQLAEFAQAYILDTKFIIIEWLVNKLLIIEPSQLKFSGIVAGTYAAVTAVEAIGLWYQQSWAMWLVLGLVGISIPLEIFELFQSITIIKSIVFLLNIAMFLYLLRHVVRERSNRSY
jgi:uncharacterized membrane protein (DUF2068 family)